MRILMIGFDRTMIPGDSGALGDTVRRHVRYVERLREEEEDAGIDFLLPVGNASVRPQYTLTDGLRVIPCKGRRWAFRFNGYQKVRSTLDDYDLIVSTSPFDDASLALALGRASRKPVHVQMRSSFLDNPMWVKERPVLNRARNVLGKKNVGRATSVRVICRGEKDRLGSVLRDDAARISYLPPMVDLSTFTRPITTEELDARRSACLNLFGEEGPYFLYVGRMSREKNIGLLLKALSRQERPANFVMIGDGPCLQDWRRLGERLGVDRRIAWLGKVPHSTLRPWFAGAIATILVSHYEGFGKVILESQLMGTPVVTTPFVSAPELVGDGRAGRITPDFTDPVPLARILDELSTDKEAARRMGARARDHAIDYIPDERSYLDRLVAIWQDTVAIQ